MSKVIDVSGSGGRLDVRGAGGITLPSQTPRPSTSVNGTMRWNEGTSEIEYWDGSWKTFIDAAFLSANYLPLVGGQLSGNLTFSSGNITLASNGIVTAKTFSATTGTIDLTSTVGLKLPSVSSASALSFAGTVYWDDVVKKIKLYQNTASINPVNLATETWATATFVQPITLNNYSLTTHNHLLKVPTATTTPPEYFTNTTGQPDGIYGVDTPQSPDQINNSRSGIVVLSRFGVNPTDVTGFNLSVGWDINSSTPNSKLALRIKDSSSSSWSNWRELAFDDSLTTNTNNLQSQIDSLNTGKSNVGHTHVLADITNAGNAAARNVGTSVGNVVEVISGGRLPVLDGSLLTNVLKVATTPEAIAGVSDVVAISPLKLRQANAGLRIAARGIVKFSPAVGSGGAATASLRVKTIAVNNGGTGYSVGNTITVTGGSGTSATATVATVSSGVITGLTLLATGNYTALPTATGAATTVSPSGGTGATVNLTFELGVITVTSQGQWYVVPPAITFSSGTGTASAVTFNLGNIQSITINDRGTHASIPTVIITANPSLAILTNSSGIASITYNTSGYVDVFLSENLGSPDNYFINSTMSWNVGRQGVSSYTNKTATSFRLWNVNYDDGPNDFGSLLGSVDVIVYTSV